ncbi:CoA transferase [Verticiella sediminum]|uniref:CoA transferase n=1 Tax=Verticiella sediminum TaxID=1247510 RepID=A0A556AGL7_9BURK|nr:CoA transferase [Verticiella sediminum]TSH92025.1 CoA transferase [Verticiella sediminum]
MKPLEGIRVVDMGLWVAGPATGGILADWGADVLKLEMPGGDPMRRLFGALSGSKESRCPPFDLYNRGKKSIALDVNHPEGAELARKLIADADVFVSNMRPQFLQRVGLDPATLLSRHPRLVYASLTAYGLTGPDRDAPGFDMAAFSGRSGIAERATPTGGTPPTLPGGMGDNITAITLTAGIMAALFHRERTGQGQLVSTSLLRAGVYSIGMDVATRIGLGRIAAPPARTKPVNPLMNLYCAGDGKWFWLVGAESERHWPRVVEALGAPELRHDERYASPRERRRHATELVAAIDAITAHRPRAEWAAIFARHDVWWAPINSVDELLEDPQALACGAFVRVPGVAGGFNDEDLNGVATPVDFGAAQTGPAGPPPAVGAHTDDVLSRLGLNAADIARLRDAGVLPSLDE